MAKQHLAIRERMVRDMRSVPASDVARIYDQAGDGYAAYADGDPDRLFAFSGTHGYADRRLWELLDSELSALRRSGRADIAILDAGCGPGMWLRRLVTRAVELGFTRIYARGFDIAAAQIARARLLSRNLACLPGVLMEFDVADLSQPLPERDGTIDLTLCLYSVLSHLDIASLPRISAELARVTSGRFVTTVRPVGSPPSAFIASIETARSLELDNEHDKCRIELSDGRCFTMNIHLFTACELRGCFERDFEIETLRGLDLFHSRFSPDPRWNPAISNQASDQFSNDLARIEETFAADPRFIEHATHLLLVARRRAGAGS